MSQFYVAVNDSNIPSDVLTKINVQTGTSPVVPAANTITFNGATVLAGTNPVRTDGTAPATMALEVQLSQALAATDATKVGLSNFDSKAFTVDANGFVQLIGSGTPTVEFDVDAHTAPGTDPVVPTALGVVKVTGSSTPAGTTPVQTNSLAANTYTIEVQKSQAIAATDATKVGLSNFDSAFFTVDANGFVSLTGSTATSYVEDSGSATPSGNILNIVGGTGISTSGTGNTVTISAVNDSFNWSEQNTSFAAAVQNGYYCNAGLTATLPATAGLTIGNTIIIYVDTTSPVIIQANTGQMIQVGNTISSSGGTTTSSTQGALLQLNFKPSDTTWHCIASMGSWSTV